MAVEVLMPALSPTMTEGKLSKWSKSVGDAVKPGDILAEIETDKATMEVEAVEEGVLDQILVPAGTEGVAVNTPIAIVRGEGEAAGAAPKAASKAAPAPAAAPAEAKAPAAPPAAPAKLSGVVRRTLEDEVALPKIVMAFHSPAHFAPGDADLDILSSVLQKGKTSRLYKALVYDKELAQSVSASQVSQELGSYFEIEAIAHIGKGKR